MRLTELCLVCSPLCLPSLYLSYRLVRRRFLHTVFNQHIALMFLVTGLHVPIMTASSGYLLASSSSLSSSNRTRDSGSDLMVCKWWYSVHAIWIILIMFGCLFALFFRYILVLFPDRGLVAKTGTNLKYFNILFWLKLVACCTLTLGNIFGNLIMDNNFFTDIPIGGLCARQDFQDSAWNLKSSLMTVAVLSVIEVHILKFTFSIKKRARKAMKSKVFGKYQRNLLTMDQTQYLGTFIFLHQAIVVLLLWCKTYINSLLSDDQLFFMLVLSYLIILDITLGFILPLLIVVRSQERFPDLWTSNNEVGPSGPKFYVIEPTIKPRRDIELNHSEQSLNVQIQVLKIEVQPVHLANSYEESSF